MILVMLKMIFLITCWVMMWKIGTAEGMLFEGIGKWADKMNEKYKIIDGLLLCPWCLPNIHGLLFVYPLAFGMGILEWWDWRYLMMYPFVLGASSFVCGNLWDWYLRNNAKKELYEQQTAYYEMLERETFVGIEERMKN